MVSSSDAAGAAGVRCRGLDEQGAREQGAEACDAARAASSMRSDAGVLGLDAGSSSDDRRFLADGAVTDSSSAREDASHVSQAGDASSPEALAVVPFAPGEPMISTANVWEYIAFPETRCRDGSSTGLAINVNPSSDNLLLFLDQGGACFNVVTCLLNPVHWDERDMMADAPFGELTNPTGVLSRSDPNNPFRDWNLVFVPYCSGDAFTGTTAHGYEGQPQQGYLNIGEYLTRIVPTFSRASQVVLSGVSAGGFGAAWNWMRVQDAFGEIPVHLLDDSGPPLIDPYLSTCMQKKLGELWGWKQSLHPAWLGSDPAQGNVTEPAMLASLARAGNRTRAALVSNDEDFTIRTFFGFGLNECQDFDALLPPEFPLGMFPEGLAAIRHAFEAYPHFAEYQATGTGHVLLLDPASVTSAGVNLASWLRAFLAGSPDFVNVVPGQSGRGSDMSRTADRFEVAPSSLAP